MLKITHENKRLATHTVTFQLQRLANRPLVFLANRLGLIAHSRTNQAGKVLPAQYKQH